MKKFKIRKTTKKDIDDIIKIIIAEFRRRPWKERWTKERASKTIRKILFEGKSYVALKDGKVVGFIITTEGYSFEGPLVSIEYLAVLKKYQRQGVGEALLKRIEKDYKKKKFSKIYIDTMKKANAYKFYCKRGYKDSKYFLIEKKIK